MSDTMSESKPAVTPSDNPEFRHSADFAEVYSNNVQFESSVWDLRTVFGVLQQPKGEPAFVDQHTAVTLPWPQAKLLHYFLGVQLAAHEALNGKINIPASVLPVD